MAAVLALVGVAALVLAACERRATHETGMLQNAGYDPDQVFETGQATYRITAEHAYDGSAFSAKAHYEGHTGSGSPPPSRAYGGFDVNLREGKVGAMAAAFYFPAGTFTGSTPAQEGGVDIMRWDGPEDTFGTIRIGADHEARLQYGKTGESDVTIGDAFRLQEGCWNWLAVNQKITSDPSVATNRVYLNRREIIHSNEANKYDTTSTDAASTVQFGMPRVETGNASTDQNDRSLDIYVDDAYVSNGSIPPPGAGACAAPEPNVLFIVTDDQRASDTLQAMPKTLKWFRTGGVDNGDVIEPGIEFGQGYATTPLCCPARASILTGKYAHNHGVRNNDQSNAVSGNEAGTQVQSMLKSSCPASPCYRTGIVGKYFNDWNPYVPPPNFDEYWISASGYRGSTVNNFQSGAYFTSNMPSDDTIECSLPGETDCTYSTRYIESKAREFIDRGENNDSEPWFLYVAPFSPHAEGSYADRNPDQSPNPFGSMTDPTAPLPLYDPGTPASAPSRSEGPLADPRSTNSIDDKPSWVRNWSQGSTILKGTRYDRAGTLRDQSLRALSSADDMIDSVLQRLKEKGEERDTIAVFISDNGLLWREHGLADTEREHTSTVTACPAGCGLSSKAQPYLESIKVPLMMRWPANSSARQTLMDNDRFVANIDLAPTALDAAGAPIPASMDGRSLLDRSQPRTEILTENWVGGPDRPWASLRGRIQTQGISHEFQYTEYYGPNGKDPEFREYYDLTTDPSELNNLYGGDGVPGTADDLGTPPQSSTDLQNRVAALRACKGSTCQPGNYGSPADTQPPRIQVDTPLDGETIGPIDVTPARNFYFQASAFDNVAVSKVEFWVDGVPSGTDTQWPYRSDYLGPFAPGTTHELRAVATDSSDNQSNTVQITVKVDGFDVQATHVVADWRHQINPGTNPPRWYRWEDFANGPTGPGWMEPGDFITYSFNRAIEATDILPGWVGDPTQVTVRINPDVDIDPGNPAQGYNDAITIPEVPNLGTLNLGSDNFWGWRLPGSHADVPATMIIAPDQQSVTITLGSVSGLGIPRSPQFNTMLWVPSPVICGSPSCRIVESLEARLGPDGEF